MAPLDAPVTQPVYDAPQKDLYEIGEIPPLGYVPKQMYAWAIRRERHGEPDESFKVEVVDTPMLDSNEVLVFVHGRRRQLQRRLGRARHPDLAVRRAQGTLSHRRLATRRGSSGRSGRR